MPSYRHQILPATGFVDSGPIVFQNIAGKVETVRLPAADRIYTIEEGKGITAALCAGTPCGVSAAPAAQPVSSKP